MVDAEREAWTSPSSSLKTLVSQLEERVASLSAALDVVRTSVQMIAVEAMALDAEVTPPSPAPEPPRIVEPEMAVTEVVPAQARDSGEKPAAEPAPAAVWNTGVD